VGKLPRIYIHSKKNGIYATENSLVYTRDINDAVSFSFFSIKKYFYLRKVKNEMIVSDWGLKRIQFVQSSMGIKGGMKL